MAGRKIVKFTTGQEIPEDAKYLYSKTETRFEEEHDELARCYFGDNSYQVEFHYYEVSTD